MKDIKKTELLKDYKELITTHIEKHNYLISSNLPEYVTDTIQTIPYTFRYLEINTWIVKIKNKENHYQIIWSGKGNWNVGTVDLSSNLPFFNFREKPEF